MSAVWSDYETVVVMLIDMTCKNIVSMYRFWKFDICSSLVGIISGCVHHCYVYACATVKKRYRRHCVFWSVHPWVSACVCPEHIVSTISQNPMKGISPSFGHRCISVCRCADWILGLKGQGHSKEWPEKPGETLWPPYQPMKGISPNFFPQINSPRRFAV